MNGTITPIEEIDDWMPIDLAPSDVPVRCGYWSRASCDKKYEWFEVIDVVWRRPWWALGFRVRASGRYILTDRATHWKWAPPPPAEGGRP